jgi:hypothetical protein
MTVKAATASTMMTMTVAQAMTMMTNTVGGERYDNDDRDNEPGRLRLGYGWGLIAGTHTDNTLSNLHTGLHVAELLLASFGSCRTACQVVAP